MGAALHEVLVEQILEVEAAEERVALEAAVREIAARHARALAVLERADAARGERALVERGGELRGHGVERQEAVLVGRQRRIDEDGDDRAALRAALQAAALPRQQTAGQGRAAARRPRGRLGGGNTSG